MPQNVCMAGSIYTWLYEKLFKPRMVFIFYTYYMCILLINAYSSYRGIHSFFTVEGENVLKIAVPIQGNECVLVMNARHVCFLFIGHRVNWSREVQKAA